MRISLASKLRLELSSYETQDGLYDAAWSEIHENQLVTASGDGSIKLWDVMIKVCFSHIFARSPLQIQSAASASRTYQYVHGKSIREKSSPSTGPISLRTSSSRPPGTAQ